MPIGSVYIDVYTLLTDNVQVKRIVTRANEFEGVDLNPGMLSKERVPMATIHPAADLRTETPARPQAGQYPADSRPFEIGMILLSAWFLGGVFLDGWAHNHLASLESFFTPWHAVLYSGFFAVAALIGFTQYRSVSRGYQWTRALPRGYGLSLVGVVVFFAGGVGDMLWHTLFGIEQNVEALFSPTHLLLGTGAALFLSGPLRAAWSRPNLRGWRDLWPAVVSLLMLLALFTFFTQYADLIDNPGLMVGFRPSGGSAFFTTNVSVIASVIIPSAIIVGLLLFALRRWQLPFGAVTLILTVDAMLMVLMRWDAASPFWRTIPATALAGLLADLFIWRLRPSLQQVWALRLFAFALPFVLFLLLFGAIAMSSRQGLWWEIHMWLGVPFEAGAVGFGLSCLAVPPQARD
jgi:hypothetical protein